MEATDQSAPRRSDTDISISARQGDGWHWSLHRLQELPRHGGEPAAGPAAAPQRAGPSPPRWQRAHEREPRGEPAEPGGRRPAHRGGLAARAAPEPAEPGRSPEHAAEPTEPGLELLKPGPAGPNLHNVVTHGVCEGTSVSLFVSGSPATLLATAPCLAPSPACSAWLLPSPQPPRVGRRLDAMPLRERSPEHLPEWLRASACIWLPCSSRGDAQRT
mmetsp:Transcript_117248/g.314341  ORF Transcript_117248/g.314341 Transcript_117248/m.314341 type:complete len:217 (+) Transcript_117248:418-1068(+)